MSERELFSIVVPVYNGRKYIQETLDSIYAQTYTNYELIVVDGASNDGTLDVLANNKDHIHHLLSEKDKGMYDALNKGFALSKGKYLCYINADDRLLPHALEKAVAKFKKGNYDLVFGDVNFISETSDVIFRQKAFNFSHSAISKLARVPFAQQSSFWTKEMYEARGGFDQTLKYVADSKFLLQLCTDPKVKKGYIPFTMGEYRLHADSFSVGSTSKMITEAQKMLSDLKLKKEGISRLVYELIFKIYNIRNIYKRLTYKGAKF